MTKMYPGCFALFFVAATLMNGAKAFVVPTRQQTTGTSPVPTTRLNSDATGWDSFSILKKQGTNIPGGEEQRKFRRTVYSHDDWRLHRSQDRFFYYLAAIFKSGVYKNLGREVGLVTLVATFVCVYNGLVGGYTDFNGVAYAGLNTVIPALPKFGIPISAFTLTSPSLGLLLVFRTNTSYQRWDEARKNWGMNINHTRNLNRMANAYYDATGVPPEVRKEDLNHVALCTWAFVRAMKRHLSPEWEDEADFRNEVSDKLPAKQAEMLIGAVHRPNRALQDLSYAIDDLPMHFMRKNEIHRACTIFEDNLGSSERILTSPVPLFYSRHLARFLAVWLLLLPFGAYDSFNSSWNHIELIPAMAVISTMLFGIEEIGTQLEEPFTVLPMQVFCDKIYNWLMEIAKWVPGDNGRAMRPVKAEHAYFINGSPDVGYAAPAPEPQYYAPPPEPQYYAPAPAPAPQYYSPPPPSPPPQYSPPVPSQNLEKLDFAEFLKRQGKENA